MTSRRAVLLSFALGAVLLTPAATHASEPAATARTELRRADLRNYFTPEDFERSRRYRAPRYALAFIGIGAEIAALLAIGLAGGTRRMGSIAARLGGQRWWLQVLVITLAVTLVLALVDLPFGLGRHNMDRAWGLSTQTLGGYLSDVVRAYAFNLVVTLIGAVALVGLARALPHRWPIAVAGAGVVLTVALSTLWPLIYEPLFNKFTPVDPALRDRIVQLGVMEGVKVGSVVVADASRRTTTQNAYVSGLGATKRVVLYDTLLQKSSEREVELVVAHELAHVAHHDVAKGTVLGAVGAIGAVLLLWWLLTNDAVRSYLGISGAGDAKALPFVALVLTVAGLLAMPVGNWYSRMIEADADRTAVRVTHDPQTAIDVEVNLARDNIADLQPNGFVRWAFFTHPSTRERIEIAIEEAK
jgi:STE24 endopeptidase